MKSIIRFFLYAPKMRKEEDRKMKRFLFVGFLFLIFPFTQVANPHQNEFRAIKGLVSDREFRFKTVNHEQLIKKMNRQLIKNLPAVQQHPIEWEIWIYPSIQEAEEALAEFLDKCSVAFHKLETPEIGDNTWEFYSRGIAFTYMNSYVLIGSKIGKKFEKELFDEVATGLFDLIRSSSEKVERADQILAPRLLDVKVKSPVRVNEPIFVEILAQNPKGQKLKYRARWPQFQGRNTFNVPGFRSPGTHLLKIEVADEDNVVAVLRKEILVQPPPE